MTIESKLLQDILNQLKKLFNSMPTFSGGLYRDGRNVTLDNVNTATDGQVMTADGAGGITWEDSSGGLSYNVYTALLTQVSTDTPTAVILENTLGTSISFTYTSPGYYEIHAVGNIFLANKTYFTCNQYGGNHGNYNAAIERLSDTVLLLRISLDGTGYDTLLANTPFEIRVYP